MLNMYKKLTHLRKTAPAFQTNHLSYVIINEQIFSFLRTPDSEDEQEDPYSFLVTINFSNTTTVGDYASILLDQKLEVLGNLGAITVSSDMDRNGRLVDMSRVELKAGEALVIETMTMPSSASRHPYVNLALLMILMLAAFYVTNWSNVFRDASQYAPKSWNV